MPDYKRVNSSLEISKKIADCLEDIDPIQYNGQNRARRIRNVNDHIQGRNDMPLDELLDWAAKAQGGSYTARVLTIRRSIQDFREQKALLETPYAKSGSGRQYKYKTMDLDLARPLKVIDQPIYDRAAKAGFPPDFFRESYFDQVTFYCLPDHADCNFSRFYNCTFAVCRIQDARFDGISLFSSEFHSCVIDHTTFFHATLADTHFHDCNMAWVSFQRAKLARCNFLDCAMDSVNFMDAILDGCGAGRCQIKNIRCLDQATVTMGGATGGEIRANRAAIFRAMGVPEPQEKKHRPRNQER
nr:pentapeptide repeat-containing protein [uncultured Oscillibacter sp.]